LVKFGPMTSAKRQTHRLKCKKAPFGALS